VLYPRRFSAGRLSPARLDHLDLHQSDDAVVANGVV